ncbi:MAG: serine hydrolase [Chloroflexi bacterium]|nr:serine hydrolase [Chloroflexota bacterium]
MTVNEDIKSLEPRIVELMTSSMAQDRIPGLSVGIVRGDALAAHHSLGTQKIGVDLLPTTRTISRVASITKTFTATAILQLRDLGQLELDDPLLVHMPDFTVASALQGTLEGVTLRRMMTHYSGLSTEHPLTDWNTPSFPTTEELLSGLSAIEVVIPQDSQWKYSNLAVGLLGHVIEQVSGLPYEQYVYEEITGPLGLRNTRYELDSDQAKLKSTGYSHPVPGSSDRREAPYAPLRGISSAGQLHSNIEDLSRWMSFQFTAGRNTHPSKVLSASTLAEMHRPVYMSSDWKTGQAIGWRLSRRGDLVLHNHGGGIQGYASNMVFSVQAQTGVIVLANIWPAPGPYVLAEDIAEIVIKELGPVAERAESELIDLTEAEAAGYVGRYWAEPGVFVDVVYSDSELRLDDPREGDYTLHGPAALKKDPTAKVGSEFKVMGGRGAGELAKFSLGESGKPESFRLGGFLYRIVD